MNMGDLAQMAAARARSSPAIIDEGQEDEEESPELKTPTADNQHVSMIPGAAASNQAVATTKVMKRLNEITEVRTCKVTHISST